MSALSKYAAVVGVGVQNTLVYRVNFFFRALFGFIPLLAVLQLWRAVYAGKTDGTEIAGITLSGMVSYYLVVAIVDALTSVNEDDWQIAADIKDGAISQFLLKPVSYVGYRLALFASGRLIYCATALLPLCALLFYFRASLVWPDDPALWAAFALSLALSALLQFFISCTVAMLAFWVLEVSTLVFIVFAFEYIASGQLFPLAILPPWMQDGLWLTPFPFQMYFPTSLFLGRFGTAEILWGLAVQASWVALFYFVNRFVWLRGIRHYSAVGG
jgi:ABC-2 type transport system permease protein